MLSKEEERRRLAEAMAAFKGPVQKIDSNAPRVRWDQKSRETATGKVTAHIISSEFYPEGIPSRNIKHAVDVIRARIWEMGGLEIEMTGARKAHNTGELQANQDWCMIISRTQNAGSSHARYQVASKPWKPAASFKWDESRLLPKVAAESTQDEGPTGGIVIS